MSVIYASPLSIEPPPARAKPKTNLVTLIVATSIGNALEWFDIAIYVFFAGTISKVFFPTADPKISLMLTLGTSGVAYLARPLGAIVLGAYADRIGRRQSMTLSLFLMMLGTATLAFMPSYATVGLVAPIGVLCARLLQGFAGGGEFGSATALLAEHTPKRRGFIASFQFASQGLSLIFASLFGFVMTSTMSPETLLNGGWRIPFVFGLLVGPVGLYIRRHLDESGHPEESRSPIKQLVTRQWPALFLAIGSLVISTSIAYLLNYMPTYAVEALKLPQSVGFAGTLASSVILTVVTPFAGLLSDRVGRIRMMVAAVILLLLTIYPAFVMLTTTPSIGLLLSVLLWFALMKAVYYGALPALMAEQFPSATRASGLALSYNMGVTIFGGFGPFVMKWLDNATGTKLGPAYYLTAVAVISLISLSIISRRPRIAE